MSILKKGRIVSDVNNFKENVSAVGLPDSIVKTKSDGKLDSSLVDENTIQPSITSNVLKPALNANNAPPIFAVRAWCVFDGTTTPPTILGAGNVSSVVRNATGDYTINFAISMPTSNYAFSVMAKYSPNMGGWGQVSNSAQLNSNYIRFTGTRDSTGGISNSNTNSIIIVC